MKILNKISNGLALVASIAALGLTSCADEPDKYESTGGVPRIDYIRCLSSEIKSNTDTEETVYTNGQLVEEAGPQSTLCLVGDNLRSIVEVFFNDQKANLNTSVMTDNAVIVSVPVGIPNAVTDKIYMVTTGNDTVSYDFHVVIPAPEVNAMTCEYAKAGEDVTIFGRYMIPDPSVPLTVSFKNAAGNPIDVIVDTKTISEDRTSFTVTVPEGAEEGEITVTSIYGSAKSPFRYKDSRGMLFTFDDARGNNGWHPRDIISDETSLDGNYMQLGPDALDADAGWNDGKYSFEYWPGSWEDPETFTNPSGIRLTDLFDADNWENMSLKFELNIPADNPWMAGALQIIPTSTATVTNGSAGTDAYGNPTGGANNVYISGGVVPRALYRPWTTNGGSYDTGGKWVTVTIPLASALAYGPDGSPATGSVTPESFAGLTLFLCSGGVPGTECNPILKIDNIRIVPNK